MLEKQESILKGAESRATEQIFYARRAILVTSIELSPEERIKVRTTESKR